MVDGEKEELIAIIRNHINQSSLFSLKGKALSENQFEVYSKFRLWVMRPNFGPLVYTQILVERDMTMRTSKVTFKRKNGMTYKFHFWLTIVFATSMALGVLGSFLWNQGLDFPIGILAIIGVIIGYIFIMELITAASVYRSMKKIREAFEIAGHSSKKGMTR